MITVSLVGSNEVSPIKVAQHAAHECYRAENQEFGPGFESKLNVEKALWKTGHHTTLEHAAHYFTFQIEGIAVSEVTFGLHLTTPYYNTSQRSGRFCADMFRSLDINDIYNYIRYYWSAASTKPIIDYIVLAHELYEKNLSQTVKLATQCLGRERPNAKPEYITDIAPKIAQEQLRMFIPTIFPTGLDYTIDLVTLASLHRCAWLPGMRAVVNKMVKLVLERYPELAFIRSSPEVPVLHEKIEYLFESMAGRDLGGEILCSPRVDWFDFSGVLDLPEPEEAHPLDMTTVVPWLMSNNDCEVQSMIEISLATMGQDQRHRSIKRTLPTFTGNFYLPPLLHCLNLKKDMATLQNAWLGLQTKIPRDLFVCLAPYGAMVYYKKRAPGNAFIHETAKRLCWCAQEEIYEVNRRLRNGIRLSPNGGESLVKAFSPTCAKTGKCGEGRRYCGRDLSLVREGDFPKRIV